VLFLDEPTLGLDVGAQRRIRAFLAEINRRSGATILLTSHAMADVEALCERVLVIHRGALLFDGGLSTLRRRFATHKTLSVQVAPGAALARAQLEALEGEAEVTAAGGRLVLRVPAGRATALIARVVALLPVTDITVADPPPDEVVEGVFAGAGLAEPPGETSTEGAGGG
jgi:ABC-2 type transport system ATP-binding protein